MLFLFLSIFVGDVAAVSVGGNRNVDVHDSRWLLQPSHQHSHKLAVPPVESDRSDKPASSEHHPTTYTTDTNHKTKVVDHLTNLASTVNVDVALGTSLPPNVSGIMLQSVAHQLNSLPREIYRTSRSVTGSPKPSLSASETAEQFIVSPLMNMGNGTAELGIDVRSNSHFFQSSLSNTGTSGSGGGGSSSSSSIGASSSGSNNAGENGDISSRITQNRTLMTNASR